MNRQLDNDYVIVRNDGVVIRNTVGDYRLFTSKDVIAVNRAISELQEFCKKINATYSFTAILYNDLPNDKKYNL